MSIQKPQTNGIGLTTIFQSVERNEELFSSRCRHAYSTWTKVSTISSRGSSLTPVHKKLDKNLNRRVVRLNIFPLSRLPRVTLVVFAIYLAELLNIFLLSLCDTSDVDSFLLFGILLPPSVGYLVEAV